MEGHSLGNGPFSQPFFCFAKSSKGLFLCQCGKVTLQKAGKDSPCHSLGLAIKLKKALTGALLPPRGVLRVGVVDILRFGQGHDVAANYAGPVSLDPAEKLLF